MMHAVEDSFSSFHSSTLNSCEDAAQLFLRVCDKNLNVNSALDSTSCYDTGCEAQGILPPGSCWLSTLMIYVRVFMCVYTEGVLGGLRQGVMTPHKLHNSSASKRILHFLSTIRLG